MKYADLHLHTEFSDGTYSVEELIRIAKENGLACISITDHDNIDALDYLSRNIPNPGIEIIPGIEITTDVDNFEAHILGYFIDFKNQQFLHRLERLKEARKKRIYDMAGKLKDLGITVNPEEVFSLSRNGTVGRLHLARVMHKNGIVSTTNEAFYKYIGDGAPAYVARFRLTPFEAISEIIKVGGIPILAHPYNLRDQDLIYSFLDFGLKGIEAYYPEHSPSITQRYINLAKKYNLLVTGGSDCHGKARYKTTIGRVKIPYELVERLKKVKQNL